nr:circularly permuted type 2 ATP-grasp protein [uncultured Stenotrophomonas sp.]
MQKFDEMYEMLPFDGSDVRSHYQRYGQWLSRQPAEAMNARRAEAEMIFRRVGITFAVYGAKDEEGAGTERLIPFDLIPRIIPAHEWARMQQGLVQRVTALNRFIHDIYHGQDILHAGIVPTDLIVGNAQFRPEMAGVDVPRDVYAHIAGIDIVRAPDGQGNGIYYVLEDNLRVPSGVSYMLENRKMMMRLFPDLFRSHRVAPVAHYPDLLLDTLRASAPAGAAEPTVVVLTPGMYNSAYFEHAFLAQQMGVELVEGQDLVVKDNFVYMRTTRGLQRVDVIYRRVDDDFLDPQVFRNTSTLGCAGLMAAYRAGNVAICNAVGTGIADDKSVYPYVPEMIRFYLGEEPILANVPTWMCRKKDDLNYVLDHLHELVVKEVHGAGGYGMLIGPAATRAEIEEFRAALLANPAGYIAQPTLSLSSCPTYVESGIAPRHIDLRPFVLSGQKVQMVAGGLTRVALKEGSLVVNSSQGGGTKDTWVLGEGDVNSNGAQGGSMAQSLGGMTQTMGAMGSLQSMEGK